ncbi:hypothetical protein Tco_0451322 [Tanacetum coccineum]
MWNLKVKGTDVVTYNQRFQELALMCDRMFLEESDKVEKYVDGLPDMIHGSVMATKPKTMQHAIEFTTELMDKKISTLAERQAEKQEENLITTNKNSNNNFQEGRSGSSLRRWEWGKGRTYGLGSSLCNKCKFHPPIARALFKNVQHCKRVGPFKVLEQVESVAYKLKLPQELSRVHNTFHVSNLRKCYADEPLAVPLGGLHLDNEL